MKWHLDLLSPGEDLSHTALLVVDMQSAYTDPSYDFARFSTRAPEIAEYYYGRLANVVIPNFRRLINIFRGSGLKVVYVTNGSRLPDRSDLSRVRRANLAKWERELSCTMDYPFGSPGATVRPELEPRPGDLVVHKTSFSAFNSTGLNSDLRKIGIGGLVIGGVTTSACVESTARDAADLDYVCTLVEDACAAFLPREHEATVEVYRRLFGRVATTEEVVRELAAYQAAYGSA